MAGNSIGTLFRVTTFGESHGKAIGCIIDGMPPNMPLSEIDIQPDLDRRKPGNSQFTTPRRENDEIQIISGVFEGKTTGTSIGLLINNADTRSQDYDSIKDKFRPGHADFTYQNKYGIRDHRGGGRSSARETAMRVAAGAIAKKYLNLNYGITINGFVSQIGDIKIADEFENPKNIDWQMVNSNPFFCPDPNAIENFSELLREIKKSKDSIGAKVVVLAQNVPVGLGEPVFDRLDADLAHCLMSINAVKAVSFGAGFDVISMRGSECSDPILPNGFKTNNAGGILGGISNGDIIKAELAFKPTSSIGIANQSIDINNNPVEIITKGRHDPCVGIRGVVVAEAMMAIILMDHLLRFKAQCDFR